MVFRIGWISMGARLSYEFGEKPASITESAARRQTRRAVACRSMWERPCVAIGARSGPRFSASQQILPGPLCGPFATQGRSHTDGVSPGGLGDADLVTPAVLGLVQAFVRRRDQLPAVAADGRGLGGQADAHGQV